MLSRLKPEDQARVEEYLQAPHHRLSVGLIGPGCSCGVLAPVIGRGALSRLLCCPTL
ncbi:DUF3094 family protein [Pseudomonas sp.]|uniref:DUF3094 family protein n=1 Tax=Pseudomonas sp. TaxID=306 RepID=UPI002EDAD048